MIKTSHHQKSPFLIKSIIGLGDYSEMEALIKNLSPEILEESVVKSALSSYELKNSVIEVVKTRYLIELMPTHPICNPKKL